MDLKEIVKIIRQIKENIVEQSFREVLGFKDKFVVAVDFDGTIAIDKFPETSELIPGAVEGLKKIKDLGGRIVIFTGRAGESGEVAKRLTGRDAVSEMEDFLNEKGVPYDEIWVGAGKPIHDFLIDDRSVPPFDGDWGKAVGYIEKEISDKDFVSVLDVIRF